MGLLSLFKAKKKNRQLKCDWCCREMEAPACTKHAGKKVFVFCSEECKKRFRKSGNGKSINRACPSCPMSPKSWD